MDKALEINTFMELAGDLPVIDVRTPAEFEQGHIPGAHNVPLFTNDERAEIGTLYNHKGRDTAIKRGLEMTGPRMQILVEKVKAVVPDNRVLVHCWRGGMRSESMAWLLNFTGMEASTLEGGYKKFRRYVLETFAMRRNWIVLGGLTGSGKTYVLWELGKRNEQVIDLEGLANHKGSAFGWLGEEQQPTTEQFENCLAMKIRSLDPDEPIWIEDESRHIGRVILPQDLFSQMREALVIELRIPMGARLNHLVSEYSVYPVESLRQSILKIQERLGGLKTKQAVEALETGDFNQAAEFILYYYDKAYRHGLEKRPKDLVHPVSLDSADPSHNAEYLQRYAKKLLNPLKI